MSINVYVQTIIIHIIVFNYIAIITNLIDYNSIVNYVYFIIQKTNIEKIIAKIGVFAIKIIASLVFKIDGNGMHIEMALIK